MCRSFMPELYIAYLDSYCILVTNTRFVKKSVICYSNNKSIIIKITRHHIIHTRVLRLKFF